MIEQNLKITYAQIEEYSADLLTYLGSLNCVQAKAYVLPRVLQEDTYTTIERIEPQYFDDFIAETKIRRSFVDYYGDAHVWRHPVRRRSPRGKQTRQETQ